MATAKTKKSLLPPSLALLAVCLLSPSLFTASADVYYGVPAGSRPLHFLALPASAAALGRGTVSASGAMDASDVFRFPANTALAGGGQFFLGAAGQGGARALYAASALPILIDGAVGAFTQSTPSDASLTPNLFGLSLSKYFPEYSYGFGFSAFVSNGNNPRGGAGDLLGGAWEGWSDFRLDPAGLMGGFSADFRFDPADFLTGRVYFSSAGMPLGGDSAFDRRFAEQYGLIMNYSLEFGEYDFWKANIGAGARKTTWDGALELGAGAEFIAGGRYFMRAGYELQVDRLLSFDGPYHKLLNPSGLSLGLGAKAGGFGIDAAYLFGGSGLAGGVWSVNAAFEFEEMKKRSAEENLALARDYYGAGEFGKSRLYAARAASGDSTLWNAGALYVKSEAELRRRSGASAALIYGGNSRGTVVPYPPSPDALGGLSRYAALVSSLRKNYPVNFAVDVGNLISPGKDALRAEFAAAYYEAAKFDALTPGIGELSMGPAKFASALKGKTPVIVTNLNNDNAAASGIRSGVLLTNSGYSVYLINIITETPPESGDARIDLSYNPEAIKSQLSMGDAAKADLRVAVVHGTLEDVKRFAEQLSGVLDAVIAGSLAQRLDTPVKIGNALIVSAGAENKFAGCLFFKFNDGKRNIKDGKAAARANSNSPRARGRFTVENVLFPISQDIAPDPAVENITKLVRAAIVIDRAANPTVRVRVRGVVAHLSDRGAGPQAFLKAAQSKSELPLGNDIFQCRRPAFSSAGDRAAFIYGNPAAQNGKLRMVDLEMGTGKTVSTGKNVIDAAFSPADDFLYYIEADSGNGTTGAIRKTRMYMNDALTVIEADASQRNDLHVSADGTTLLFASKHKDGKWDIYAVDTSGKTAPTRLTDGKADHRLPRLSPDGKRAAYLSNRTGFGGKMDLWVYERSAAKHRQLTFNTDVREFSWGDDSEAIYFSAGANLLEICRVDMARGLIKNLIPHPAGTVKTWSESTPRFIRYHDAPMLVYTRIYVDGKRRIYWYDIDSARDAPMYSTGEFDEWTD